MSPASPSKLALVLSGGGARGAYEAGAIHYIRTQLSPAFKSRAFNVLCGASVGALNTCFMASTAHVPELQGNEIYNLWKNVREENIYKRNLKALFEFLGKNTRGVLMKFLRRSGSDSPHFPGFLDTSPFLPFIKQAIPWKRITRNVQEGFLDALSIVTTNVFTGRLELFIQKSEKTKYLGDALVHYGPIQPVHAAASAAIPVIFPSVMIDDMAYTDGGLRLNTPLSPAIHLGADSILVIGLNHRAKPGEKIPMQGVKGEAPALGQVLGRVMNAIFLDKIQNDMEQLDRINHIIDWCEEVYGKDFIKKMGKFLSKKKNVGSFGERGLKKLRVFRIRPSQDIGDIFSQCFREEGSEHFTSFEKFLIRFLDADSKGGIDMLSYISFLPSYLKRLLELGFEDAKSHHDEIEEFMSC